ncbi:MAG TPA: DUF5615 family PIN-like protein [Planctomycetaceae bacterium]|nr:DUF5615 family PIN-like protein [Planctomycetaceae bacterium]
MAKFLANENVPRDAVIAARQLEIDLAWIKELAPGVPDEEVLTMSLDQERVLVTFDKDFGELAFQQGKDASCGVILFRPRLQSPQFLAQFVVSVLSQVIDWEGHFAVAQETNIRVIPLPSRQSP